MHMRLSLTLGALAASTLAFGQLGPAFTPTDAYQVGYAANFGFADSVVNLSNSGYQGPFIGGIPASVGNICVNVYTFDPQEEEISCCACLVTPNGLNSLSATSDLISNPLTPAIPTAIVIKLVASQPGVPPPGTVTTGPFNVCNPSVVGPGTASVPYGTTAVGPPATTAATGSLAGGMIAWGTTIEPTSPTGTYGVVSVDFKKEMLSASELTALTSTCGFIQGDASGYGICKSCRSGALTGSKK